MQNLNRRAIMVITFFCIMLVSCQKDNSITKQNENVKISQKVTDDLSQAQQNWNANAGKLVVFKSFSVSGAIKTADERTSAISQIMDDNSVAVYGNILDESSMHMNTIGELQSQNSSTKENMRFNLESQVQVGDIIVNLLWQGPQKSFTTKCIVRDDVITWDNVLTSSIMMDINPVVVLTESKELANQDPGVNDNAARETAVYRAWYSQTNSWQGNWIWGGKRGDMGETIKIYCYSSGKVYSTDNSDWANMTLGSAKSYSKVLVNSGSYGKIQYALGIATPFASVTFNSTYFKVEVSGLGSSMVRNGSHTLYPWLV